MIPNTPKQRFLLQQIARRAMIDRGLLPDFSHEVLQELTRIQERPAQAEVARRDLRTLLWASIDNDDSRDLDQLTVAEILPGGAVKIRVAVADVDGIVRKGSAIDEHARQNTTSVYTAAQIFPMLPDRLSTDLTSLNCGEDRPAIVVEMGIDPDGTVQNSDIYTAIVRNHAKLAYNSVGSWLEGEGPIAGSGCGRQGPRREPPNPGPGGSKAEGVPARARRARPGNGRGAPGFCRRGDPGSGRGKEKSGQRAH